MVVGSVGASHRSEGSAPSFPAFQWEILDTQDFQSMTKASKKSSEGVKLEGRTAKRAKAAEGMGAGEISKDNAMYQAGIPTRAQ